MKLQKERMGLSWLFGMGIIVAAILFLLTALGDIRTTGAAEGQKQLQETLYRAAVSCYAIEGQYPPDLAYLQQHYGLQVDERRYTVFYEAIGDNMMPDITVLIN